MSTTNNASNELEHQIQDVRRRAQQLVSGLTAEQFTRRPDPAKWSIAECIARLNVTAGVVQPKIADAIEQRKRVKVTGKGPFSPGHRGRRAGACGDPRP